MTERICSIEGCVKVVKSRGMCGMHVERVRRWGDPNHVGAFIKGDDHARFWSKVERGSDAECWLWRGTLVEGYGQFRVGGKRVGAHRYAYELLVGEIPPGLQLDHVRAWGCVNRNCVNPAHLEPVDMVENVMRSDAPPAINARKNLCIRGHEFDKVTVRKDGRTRRRCSVCHRMKTNESKRRRRAARG